MAKAFRALSNIQHGEEVTQKDDDGKDVIVVQQSYFPYGSTVEGLDTEIMKRLWDAGVLEEVETSTPVVTRSSTPVQQPVQQKADPAAPNGTGETPPSSSGS